MWGRRNRIAMKGTTFRHHTDRCRLRAVYVGSHSSIRLMSFRPIPTVDVPGCPTRPSSSFGSGDRQFIRIRRSIGLNSVRLHDLRHFTATRLLSEGVPVRTVSGRLGHANAATTLGVYMYFVEESDRDAQRESAQYSRAKRRSRKQQIPAEGRGTVKREMRSSQECGTGLQRPV